MDSVIHIASYSSPLAEVNVAASDEGVISLDFNSSVSDFCASLVEGFGSGISIVRSDERFSELFSLFDDYFSGRECSFNSVKVDLKGTDFELRVWSKLRKIPFGKTLSYVELSQKAGSPRAARATGGACKKNHVPLIIPCHRVISSSRALGGYSAGVASTGGLSGIELKRALLKLEGVNLD